MEICDYCQNAYFGVKAWASPDFCSRECYEQHLITEDPYHELTGFPDAKEAVKERDEICQECGHDGSERLMDVHHIESVHSFDNPENAHSLDNLVLLCRKCHRSRHSDDWSNGDSDESKALR